MPPEMILGHPHTFNVDIWSLGISLLELANGEPPNRDNSLKAMSQIAINGIPKPLKDPAKWSPQFQDFIIRTLKSDPNERPSAVELLAHEFLQMGCSLASLAELLRWKKANGQ